LPPFSLLPLLPPFFFFLISLFRRFIFLIFFGFLHADASLIILMPLIRRFSFTLFRR